MTCHHRLLSSAAALLLFGTAAQAQSEPANPDWNAQQQTSSPTLQRQVTGRRAAPPAVMLQGNSEQAEPQSSTQAYEPMRPPTFNSVQSDADNAVRISLDQQVDILRDQVKQLLQRQAATEQMLATHVHTVQAAGVGSIKYKTIKYFLENNLEAELQIPGAGTRYYKETSGPVVTKQGPIFQQSP